MIHSKNIREALVYYEDYEYRWLDAIGKNVVKFIPQAGEPTDDSTGDPTRFTNTIVEDGAGGNSTLVNSATAGELFTLTTDNADYDGINSQLKGEAFKLTANYPLYFGIKAKVSHVNTDLLVGLCETKSDLLNVDTSHAITGSAVEGAFFCKLDTETVIKAKAYKDGSETGTATDDTTLGTDFHVFEIYWDGSTLYFYVDGTQVTSLTADLPDGDLTPSINFRTGSADARTLSVAWMRAIQIR